MNARNVVPPTELVTTRPTQVRSGVFSHAVAWLRSDVLGLVGFVILAIVVLVAIFAPWIAPFPNDAHGATHPEQVLLPPSAEHWFGTDQVGRDVLSRVIFGAQTSLIIVVCVLSIAIVIGVSLGLIAGYVGGVTEVVIMRITDIFLAFPALLLSVALTAVLTPSLHVMIIAIAVTWWPWYARLTVGLAKSIRARGFIDAARCLGQPPLRILWRHMLPNTTTPVTIQASLDAGGVILTAAALSFLGLGAREPVSEWGLMIQQGQTLFMTNWWVIGAPGLAILATGFAFNMLGEGLRTGFAPSMKVVK